MRTLLAQFTSLPFGDIAADATAQIRAELMASGHAIGPADLEIAAIAQTNRLTLVTHNTADFKRIPELALEDWQVS